MPFSYQAYIDFIASKTSLRKLERDLDSIADINIDFPELPDLGELGFELPGMAGGMPEFPDLGELDLELPEFPEFDELGLELPEMAGDMPEFPDIGADFGELSDTLGEDLGMLGDVATEGMAEMGGTMAGMAMILGISMKQLLMGFAAFIGVLALGNSIMNNQFSALKDLQELFGMMVQLYLKPISDMLFVLLKPLLIGMIKILPYWYAFMSDPVGNLKGLVKAFAEYLAGVFGVDLSAAGGFLASLFEGLLPALTQGMSLFIEGLSWLWKTAGPIIKIGIGLYISYLKWLWEDAGPALIAGFVLLVAGLKWLWEKAGPIIKIGIGLYISYLKWLWEDVGPAIVAGFTLLVVGLAWLWEKAGPIIKKGFEIYIAYLSWLWETAGPILKAGFELYINILSWLWETFGPIVKKGMEGFYNVLKWMWETFGPHIETALAIIGTAFIWFATSVLPFIESIGNFFIGLPATLKAGLADLPSKIKDAILALIPGGGIVGGGKGLLSSVTGGILGDVVITPQGKIVKTSPADFLIATRRPETLMGGGGDGGTYTTIFNIKIEREADRDIAMKVADEIEKVRRRGVPL